MEQGADAMTEAGGRVVWDAIAWDFTDLKEEVRPQMSNGALIQTRGNSGPAARQFAIVTP
jgi:hypothetical protein